MLFGIERDPDDGTTAQALVGRQLVDGLTVVEDLPAGRAQGAGAGEPTVWEMKPGRDLLGVGDLTELGENIGNHRQRLKRFAELVGGKILFPVPAYGVDLAAPFPVTRGG